MSERKFNAWLPNFGGRGWAITIICLFFFIFNMYWNSVPNVLFGIWAEQYGWVETNMSFVITISGWISLVAVLVFGLFNKKVGAKAIMITGLLGSAVGFALLACMNGNFAMYFAGVLIFYVFMVAYATIGVGSIGSSWFPHTRGAFMGIATIGMTVSGAALNPAILAFVGAGLGVSGWFWFCAGVLVVLAVLVGFVFKNNPEECGCYPDNDKNLTREEVEREFKAMQEYKKNSPWTVGKVLTTPQTWLIAIACGLPLCAGNGLMALLVPSLMAFGHDSMFGVVLLSSMWPVGLLGHYLIGVLDVKIGTRKTTLCVAIVCAISGLIIYFFGTSVVMCCIGIVLYFFSLSGSATMCMSYTTLVYGRADFENAYPVIQVIFNALGFAGVSIMALVAASFTHAAIPLVMALFAFVSIIPIMLIPVKQIGSHVDGSEAVADVQDAE